MSHLMLSKSRWFGVSSIASFIDTFESLFRPTWPVMFFLSNGLGLVLGGEVLKYHKVTQRRRL